MAQMCMLLSALIVIACCSTFIQWIFMYRLLELTMAEVNAQCCIQFPKMSFLTTFLKKPANALSSYRVQNFFRLVQNILVWIFGNGPQSKIQYCKVIFWVCSKIIWTKLNYFRIDDSRGQCQANVLFNFPGCLFYQLFWKHHPVLLLVLHF